MTTPEVKDIQGGLDELFLGSETEVSEKSQQLFEALGIQGFAEIMARSKKYGFNVLHKILADLVKVSRIVYQNMDKLPIKKKVILPEINGSYKFIVTSLPHPFLRLPSESPFTEIDTNTILLVSTGDGMHAEIAARIGLGGKLGFDYVSIMGGARIDIDHNKRTLHIHEDSGSYDSCSDQIVEWMLQEYKNQGYEVTIGMKKQQEFFKEDDE